MGSCGWALWSASALRSPGGGTARSSADGTRDPSPGGWRWTGRGADGTRGEPGSDSSDAKKEEAAAHAGAYPKEHTVDREQGVPRPVQCPSVR